MQSKNKRGPTVAEHAHIERIKAMRCVVCDQAPPTEAHEIVQGNWWLAMPLCPDCHRGSHNGLHGNRAMWRVKKLDETLALGLTVQRLMTGDTA